jgi:large subunit ribosomal protein L30
VADKLRITQVRSSNGTSPAQRETLRTLGLRGIGSTTERPDDPVFRGMVARVSHLVETNSPDPQSDRAVAEDSANG